MYIIIINTHSLAQVMVTFFSFSFFLLFFLFFFLSLYFFSFLLLVCFPFSLLLLLLHFWQAKSLSYSHSAGVSTNHRKSIGHSTSVVSTEQWRIDISNELFMSAMNLNHANNETAMQNSVHLSSHSGHCLKSWISSSNSCFSLLQTLQPNWIHSKAFTRFSDDRFH